MLVAACWGEGKPGMGRGEISVLEALAKGLSDERQGSGEEVLGVSVGNLGCFWVYCAEQGGVTPSDTHVS